MSRLSEVVHSGRGCYAEFRALVDQGELLLEGVEVERLRTNLERMGLVEEGRTDPFGGNYHESFDWRVYCAGAVLKAEELAETKRDWRAYLESKVPVTNCTRQTGLCPGNESPTVQSKGL